MLNSPLSGPVAFSFGVPISSIESTMAEAVRLAPRWLHDGIQAIEVSLGAAFDQRTCFSDDMAEALVRNMKLINNQGLRTWSVHIPFGIHLDLSDPDESQRAFVVDYYARVMKAAAEGGADLCVAHPSAEPISAEERDLHISQCRRSISELTAAGTGVRLAIECLPRTCLCSTAQETLRILDGTEAGLCMDVNHPHHEPPANFIRALADRIITTHISDDDGLDEKHWMPGKGVIRFEDVLEELRITGYTGPFLYELTPPSGIENAGLDFITNFNYLTERYYATRS